jgi:hypothetical protein
VYPSAGHVIVRWIIYALTFLVDYDADEPPVRSRLLRHVMLTAELIGSTVQQVIAVRVGMYSDTSANE